MESRASAQDGPARCNAILQILLSMPLVFVKLIFSYVKQRLHNDGSVYRTRLTGYDVNVRLFQHTLRMKRVPEI